MAIRPILRYPDPRLQSQCRTVGERLDGLEALVRDMTETMYSASGAGLAAIQVGEPIRLFIVESSVAGLGPQAAPMVFIDPEIVELSAEKELADEGCLSFPGVYVPVERSYRVLTRARNLRGELFEVAGEGLFARAMQHENDHLNGRLLADYVGRLKRQLIRRKLEREAAARSSD
ncbi:MAG: peptide deformylase [Deltaproteobacteria bacterium]|nr:peptide deformylase [Deltaproteobacteria bacterium]